MRYWITIWTNLLFCVAPQITWAQTAADKAAADTLFKEGKKLIEAGETESACAKFDASLTRFSQLGTQLALASCFEATGKLASALGAYRAAASAAGKARDAQRKRFAEDRATDVEGRVPKLLIKLEAGYRVEGLEIKRNGTPVSSAELGTPIPTDPGRYIVTASAPGWKDWEDTVSVDPIPGVIEVVVPALGKAPVKLDPPEIEIMSAAEAPEPALRSSNRRRLTYGVGGGGVALMGVSLIFGALASSKWSDSKSHCNAGRCDATGVELAESARRMGNVSTATFLIGVAGATVGGLLLFTGPSDRERRATTLRVIPAVGPVQVGVSLQGAF